MAKSESLGLEVEGVSESIRALRRWDAAAAKDAVGVFRKESKRVQAVARGAPRVHASQPSARGWIGRQASARSAGVKLNAARQSRAWATEWGMRKAWVFGRLMAQTEMSRRTFSEHHGTEFDVDSATGPGYVIQPAIRRELPRIEENLADELLELWNVIADRAGVPRGRI